VRIFPRDHEYGVTALNEALHARTREAWRW
jgi:hypothetical protein